MGQIMKQTIFFIFLLLTITLTPSIIYSGEERQDKRLTSAVKLFQEASYLNAIDELKTISGGTKENKETLEASYLIGMAYKALGNMEDAADWLQRSLKYEPLADYAVYNMGEAYLNGGNYQAALDAFSAVKTRFPYSRWRESAAFKSSVALIQLGRYDESRMALDRFMQEHPGSSLMPQAGLRIAEAYEKIGDIKVAYNQYKAVWVNHPKSPESQSAAEKMENISSSYVAKTPSEQPFATIKINERYSRVCNLLSFGLYREGAKELTTIVEEFERKDYAGRPEWFAEALLKLGGAYFKLREDNKALIALNKLSNEYSEYSSPKIVEEGAFLAARALQRSGKRVEAASAFDKIISDFPGREVAARGMFRRADMAEGDGDIAKAIQLYQSLYLYSSGSTLADDALWREGWLNYLEKDYKGAYLLFSKLLSEYPGSEFTDTATYWSARTAEKLMMFDESIGHYSDVINRFPLSYYAAISKGRISDTPVRKVKSDSYMPKYERKVPDRYVTYHLEKIKTLIDLGFKGDASTELSLAEARCTDKSTLLEIARLMTSIGEHNKAQRLVTNSLQEFLRDDVGLLESEIWTFAFPAGFRDHVTHNADKNYLNPFLIHAIIKEESAYRPDAISKAGAIGLMQLMPSTGKQISIEAGFNDYTTDFLYRSEVNISLGSSYLKKLVDNSKGKIPLAIASYNAGPNAVSTWVERYGTEEMDVFIERIPYPETRNYVKKVLRSYEIYERLYGKSLLLSQKENIIVLGAVKE